MESGSMSPSKRAAAEPLSSQELFLQNLGLIATNRVKVKYSRTIKERLRATTKEESLSLPGTGRAKPGSSPVRRKPDGSPGRAGSPAAVSGRRLDLSSPPGPSGLNIQGGLNVLQSIKRRKKIKNVTPPSTKSLLSYLYHKPSEECETEDSSSVDSDNNEACESFRLREMTVSLNRVRLTTSSPPSSTSSLLTVSDPVILVPDVEPLNGWARIDSDRFARNEQLKNLISDLEAEILERELEKEMESVKRLSADNKRPESSKERHDGQMEKTKTIRFREKQQDLELDEEEVDDLEYENVEDVDNVDVEEEVEDNVTNARRSRRLDRAVHPTPVISSQSVMSPRRDDGVTEPTDKPPETSSQVSAATDQRSLAVEASAMSRRPADDDTVMTVIKSEAFDAVMSEKKDLSVESVSSFVSDSTIKSEIKLEPPVMMGCDIGTGGQLSASSMQEEEYSEVPSALLPTQKIKPEYLPNFSVLSTEEGNEQQMISEDDLEAGCLLEGAARIPEDDSIYLRPLSLMLETPAQPVLTAAQPLLTTGQPTAAARSQESGSHVIKLPSSASKPPSAARSGEGVAKSGMAASRQRVAAGRSREAAETSTEAAERSKEVAGTSTGAAGTLTGAAGTSMGAAGISTETAARPGTAEAPYLLENSCDTDSSDSDFLIRRPIFKHKPKRKDLFLQKQLEMLQNIENQSKKSRESYDGGALRIRLKNDLVGDNDDAGESSLPKQLGDRASRKKTRENTPLLREKARKNTPSLSGKTLEKRKLSSADKQEAECEILHDDMEQQDNDARVVDADKDQIFGPFLPPGGGEAQQQHAVVGSSSRATARSSSVVSTRSFDESSGPGEEGKIHRRRSSRSTPTPPPLPSRRRSTEVTKWINSTGGWKIYRHVDLRVRHSDYDLGGRNKEGGEEEVVEGEGEEKLEMDRDDRELSEILKEKKEPERRRRGEPFYLIEFHSGDPRLDYLVNRTRQEILIQQRRVRQALDPARAINFVKFTYWQEKTDEHGTESTEFDCRFLGPDQKSKPTRKSKQFSRLSRPPLADILQARRIAGIDQESKFNYDQQELEIRPSSSLQHQQKTTSGLQQQKTSLLVRKGETHLRRRSSGDSSLQKGLKQKRLSEEEGGGVEAGRLKKMRKKMRRVELIKLKRAGLLKRQPGRPKESLKCPSTAHRPNQDYIDIDNIESLVDNEPVEDSSSCSESSQQSQQDYHKCRVCYTSFLDSQSLELHELSCKPFQCKFCRKKFRSLKLCHRHEASHQQHSAVINRRGSIKQSSKDAAASSSKTGGSIAAMDLLTSSLPSTSGALISMRTGGKEITITCEKCGAVFEREPDYMRHRQSHHPRIKPYKCSITNCEKSFIKKNSLEQHLSQHSGSARIMPWKCSKCHARFQDQNRLKRHITEVHEMQKELRAQYRMVNVSKDMKDEDYDLESMVVFDMEGLPALCQNQQSMAAYPASQRHLPNSQRPPEVNQRLGGQPQNVQSSPRIALESVQQELQAANEGLLIEVELMDSVDPLGNHVVVGDMSNLVVNNADLVHNLQQMVKSNQPATSPQTTHLAAVVNVPLTTASDFAADVPPTAALCNQNDATAAGVTYQAAVLNEQNTLAAAGNLAFSQATVATGSNNSIPQAVASPPSHAVVGPSLITAAAGQNEVTGVADHLKPYTMAEIDELLDSPVRLPRDVSLTGQLNSSSDSLPSLGSLLDTADRALLEESLPEHLYPLQQQQQQHTQQFHQPPLLQQQQKLSNVVATSQQLQQPNSGLTASNLQLISEVAASSTQQQQLLVPKKAASSQTSSCSQLGGFTAEIPKVSSQKSGKSGRRGTSARSDSLRSSSGGETGEDIEQIQSFLGQDLDPDTEESSPEEDGKDENIGDIMKFLEKSKSPDFQAEVPRQPASSGTTTKNKENDVEFLGYVDGTISNPILELCSPRCSPSCSPKCSPRKDSVDKKKSSTTNSVAKDNHPTQQQQQQAQQQLSKPEDPRTKFKIPKSPLKRKLGDKETLHQRIPNKKAKKISFEQLLISADEVVDKNKTKKSSTLKRKSASSSSVTKKLSKSDGGSSSSKVKQKDAKTAATVNKSSKPKNDTISEAKETTATVSKPSVVASAKTGSSGQESGAGAVKLASDKQPTASRPLTGDKAGAEERTKKGEDGTSKTRLLSSKHQTKSDKLPSVTKLDNPRQPTEEQKDPVDSRQKLNEMAKGKDRLIKKKESVKPNNSLIKSQRLEGPSPILHRRKLLTGRINSSLMSKQPGIFTQQKKASISPDTARKAAKSSVESRPAKSPEGKPKKKLDLSTYKHVRRARKPSEDERKKEKEVGAGSSGEGGKTMNSGRVEGVNATSTSSSEHVKKVAKATVATKNIDLDDIVRQPSKHGVGKLKQKHLDLDSSKKGVKSSLSTTGAVSNSSSGIPSTETLKQVLSVVGTTSAVAPPASSEITAVANSGDTSAEGGESGQQQEERPRDPRLHSSKQFQKQTQEVLSIVKPFLEKAAKKANSKAKKVAPAEPVAAEKEPSVGSRPSSAADQVPGMNFDPVAGQTSVAASLPVRAPVIERPRTISKMGLPAPVPAASSLSSEDEATPVRSEKSRLGSDEPPSPLTDDTPPPTVITSNQGYFTEKSKMSVPRTETGELLPGISRISSSPAVLVTASTSSELPGASGRVLPNMLPPNIPTYTSPDEQLSAGSDMSATSDSTVGQRTTRNLHKMGQTVTKSGTGDALIQIQCTGSVAAVSASSSAPSTEINFSNTSSVSYSTTKPPPPVVSSVAAVSNYSSTTSYSSTTTSSMVGTSSSLTSSTGSVIVKNPDSQPVMPPVNYNPDSQPVISSRPGTFPRAPGPGGSGLGRKQLSLPVPVSGGMGGGGPMMGGGMRIPGSGIVLPHPVSLGGGIHVPPPPVVTGPGGMVLGGHQLAVPPPPISTGGQSAADAFFQAKSDSAATSVRPRLSLPKPVPAAIAGPGKSSVASKQQEKKSA